MTLERHVQLFGCKPARLKKVKAAGQAGRALRIRFRCLAKVGVARIDIAIAEQYGQRQLQGGLELVFADLGDDEAGSDAQTARPQNARKAHIFLYSIPNVGEIRGRGLFWGIELVSDKSSKAGFIKAGHLPQLLRLTAMQNGLICYPGGITVHSATVPHIMLAPPMILEETHMLECLDKLEQVLNECLSLPVACMA